MNQDYTSFLKSAEKLGASYVDIRSDKKKTFTLTRRNKITVYSGGQLNEGYCARVFYGGRWLYGVTTERAELKDIAHTFCSPFETKNRGPSPPVELPKIAGGSSVLAPKTPFEDAPKEEKISYIKKLEDEVYDCSRTVRDLEISLNSFERDVEICNFLDERVFSRVCGIKLSFSITCKEGGRIERCWKDWGGLGGFETLQAQQPYIEEEMLKMTRETDSLVNAPYPESGKYDIVLSPSHCGAFLHETLGHAAEADNVVSGRSLLKGRMGERVISEEVTLIDDPTYLSLGFRPYDHEGMQSRRTVIIENGVLESYLHSMETAARENSEPTGHCVAENYSHTPIVRQSNTVLIPGDYSTEELIEDVERGFLLGEISGGQVIQSKGTFSISSQICYEIKKGEIVRILKGATISGDIIEACCAIDAVGNDVEEHIYLCKKKQIDSQARIVPMMRIRGMMVGGRT
jgi:TldD protein